MGSQLSDGSADWDVVVLGGERAGRDVAVEVASRGARVALVVPATGLAPSREVIGNHQVLVMTGTPRFADRRTIEVTCQSKVHRLTAEVVILATGSRPYRPATIPFDEAVILDTDGFERAIGADRVAIVGAGREGLDRAVLLAAAGVEVELFDLRRRLLEECDSELVDILLSDVVASGVTLRLGEEVFGVARDGNGGAQIQLAGGKVEHFDALVMAMGRVGNTETLGLEKIGLETDERGRAWCDERFRTMVESVRCVGSLIGFPSSLRCSLDQGTRLAVDVLFAGDFTRGPAAAVSTSGTRPDIMQTGGTTEELLADGVSFGAGRSAGYGEPGTERHFKLLWNHRSGRVLGGHGLGPDVARTVGRVAGAIRRRLTVDRLLSGCDNDLLLLEAATATASESAETAASAGDRGGRSAWRIDKI